MSTDERMRIRPSATEDRDAILALAHRLGDWFNEDGLRNLAVDLGFQRAWVAEIDGAVVGFLTCFSQDAEAQLGWMGVDPECHRQGIGRALVEQLLASLAEAGVGKLRVHTLGASVEYEPYARTRSFYASMGFTLERSEMQDNPGCPELWVLAREV